MRLGSRNYMEQVQKFVIHKLFDLPIIQKQILQGSPIILIKLTNIVAQVWLK